MSRTQRVLFVRLPPLVGFEDHHPRDVTLPIPIAYMATMVQESGRRARVIDVWATGQSMREVLAEIREESPDVVVFEADAPPYPVVLKCAESVRKELPETRLLAFGSVPSFMPGRVVGGDLPFDVAIHGEPEFTTLELLDALGHDKPLADVEGIAVWDAQREAVLKTPPRRESDDLDQLPHPDYDLFDLDRYRKYSFPMPLNRRVRWGHVLATRGWRTNC